MTVHGLPYATIIGMVRGGDWASTVIDRIEVEGRYGVRLGQTWRDAEVELRGCIEAACQADPFLREHPPTVELTGGRFSSSRIPADHPLPTGLSDVAEGVLGRRPHLTGEPYGADMRLLIHDGETPTVIFGPGDKSSHTRPTSGSRSTRSSSALACSRRGSRASWWAEPARSAGRRRKPRRRPPRPRSRGGG